MHEKTKKKPAEWAAEIGIRIIAAHGWESDKKSYDDPITEKEFFDRAKLSQCSFPKSIVWRFNGSAD